MTIHEPGMYPQPAPQLQVGHVGPPLPAIGPPTPKGEMIAAEIPSTAPQAIGALNMPLPSLRASVTGGR